MKKTIMIQNTSYIEKKLMSGMLSVFGEKDLIISKEEVFDGQTVFSDKFEKTINGYTFPITKKELEERKIKTKTDTYQIGDTVETIERKPIFKKNISELFVRHENKIYISPSIMDGNGYSCHGDKVPFNFMQIKENRKKSNGKVIDADVEKANTDFFDVNIQNYFDSTRYHNISDVQKIKKENFERNLTNIRDMFLDSIYVYSPSKNPREKLKDSTVHLLNYDIFVPICYCPTIVLTENIVDLYELANQNKIELSESFDENQLNISVMINFLDFFKKTLVWSDSSKLSEKDIDNIFDLIQLVKDFYDSNNLKELLVSDLNKTGCCFFSFNHIDKQKAKELSEKINDYTQKNIHLFPEKENIRKRIEIFNELFYNKNYKNDFKM